MRRAVGALLVLVAFSATLPALSAQGRARARRPPNALLTRRARYALLRANDLGRGWKPAAAADASPAPLGCGIANRAARAVAGADSATYSSSSSGPFVTSYSYLFANPGQRTEAWRALRAPALVGCARERFAASSSSGVVLRAQRVLLSSAPPGRRRPVAELLARVTGSASSGGEDVPAYLDVVFLAYGERICSLELATLNDPPQPALEKRLVRSLSARMSG